MLHGSEVYMIIARSRKRRFIVSFLFAKVRTFLHRLIKKVVGFDHFFHFRINRFSVVSGRWTM